MYGIAYRWIPEALSTVKEGIPEFYRISDAAPYDMTSKEESHLSLKEYKAVISEDFRPAFTPHPGHLLRQFSAENQQIDICKGLRRFIVSAR
jgi:hypothetical protein